MDLIYSSVYRQGVILSKKWQMPTKLHFFNRVESLKGHF